MTPSLDFWHRPTVDKWLTLPLMKGRCICGEYCLPLTLTEYKNEPEVSTNQSKPNPSDSLLHLNSATETYESEVPMPSGSNSQSLFTEDRPGQQGFSITINSIRKGKCSKNSHFQVLLYQQSNYKIWIDSHLMYQSASKGHLMRLILYMLNVCQSKV